MIYERTHSRELPWPPGWAGTCLVLTFLTFFSLSSSRFRGPTPLSVNSWCWPGLEFDRWWRWPAIPGALLAAATCCACCRRSSGGYRQSDQSHLFDLKNGRSSCWRRSALCLLIGLGPQPFVDLMHVSVTNLLDHAHLAGRPPGRSGSVAVGPGGRTLPTKPADRTVPAAGLEELNTKAISWLSYPNWCCWPERLPSS